jgi:hypothetical protein
MPLYFFDLSFGKQTFVDHEGIELPDAAVAREEAEATVRDLLNPRHPATPRRWAGWSIGVRDEQGAQLLQAPIERSFADPICLGVRSMLARLEPEDHDFPRGGRVEKQAREEWAGARTRLERQLSMLAPQVERCRELRNALSEEFLIARETVSRSRQLVSRARFMSREEEEGDSAAEAARAPYLTLVPRGH